MLFQRADGVVYEVVDGKAMLVDMAGKELLTLNPVGTLVWEMLSDEGDPSVMASKLVTTFEGVSVGELERDIQDFLNELVGLGLVVSGD